ncbi:PglL family O-oligosaccharyltransferase [Paenacidovorax monticola]|uniref:O-antigen ligase C-terminal domain-containing protein n=1 Tax=Paenacidovorax monticola TaxID=1926868 RepID=A0A7H0HDJ4_9BURK|nr:O-antigen ligase family protein [Paenacidovorax monticola]QNP58610.1 O-antigen ligase C-terminal domain-containing protein [Paenacidovorax monticola]
MHYKPLQWASYWFAGVLGIALLLPNHYQPWLSFHQEWLTVLALAPLLGWTLWQHSSRVQSKLPWLVVGALFCTVVASIQYALGRLYFYSDALMASAYWLLFAGAILAGQHVGQNYAEKGLQSFWLAWIAAGILSWAMALHQWLDLQYFGLFIVELPPNGRPFANLAQPNHLATLLLFSLAGAIYLYEIRTISSWTLGGLVAILCQGLVMTQSRSALLGLTLGTVVFGLMPRHCRPRLPLWGFGAIVLVYLAWALSWPIINTTLLLTDNVHSALGRTSPGIRTIYWLSALEAIIQKPWLGWGFGQIGMAQQATALHYPATHTFFSSAHNILLDIMLWMGVPCSLILLSLLYLHLRDGWNAMLTPSVSGTAWIALAFMTGHALVELPLFYTYFLIPTGFLLGVIFKDAHSGSTMYWARKYCKATTTFLILLFIAVFCKITAEYFTWEENWRTVRFHLQKYSNSEVPTNPKLILLDQIATMQEVALSQPSREMDTLALEKFRQNAARYPSSLAQLRYAYAAGLNHQPEAAAHTLKLLCSLQTQAICNSARKEWMEAAHSKWPELQSIAFPYATKHQNHDNTHK